MPILELEPAMEDLGSTFFAEGSRRAFDERRDAKN
jgi:hypothetical protein